MGSKQQYRHLLDIIEHRCSPRASRIECGVLEVPPNRGTGKNIAYMWTPGGKGDELRRITISKVIKR